jgi:SET domain-containing protein
VFAAEPGKKGDVVWRFDPLLDQMIPEEVLAAQPPHVREFLDRYGYPHHELPGILVLDADEGRFMNHADMPNLDFSTPDIGTARSIGAALSRPGVARFGRPCLPWATPWRG